MKRNQVLFGLGALVLAVAPAAHATLLSPPLVNLQPLDELYFPSAVTGNDATDHNGTNPVGTLVGSTGVEAVSSTGTVGPTCHAPCTITGSFISEVYQEAGGTLDFYYQISVNPTSTSDLEELSFGEFLASNVSSPGGVNVGQVTNVALLGTSGVPGACGFGVNPACTSVTLTKPNKGTQLPIVVTYDPSGTLSLDFAGQHPATSEVFVVSTNDTLFNLGDVSLNGNGGTAEGDPPLFAFQPASSVPEPVSIVLLGTTLALAALFIRRRHMTKASKAEIES